MITDQRQLILGHRGASHGRLDNSRDAFLAVAPEGGDGTELDVRATSDGILAVIHDPIVKGFGPVAEFSFEQLKQALNGNLISIDEALDILDGQVVNIEIKSDPKEAGWQPTELTSRLLASKLKSYSGKCSFIISSFSVAALEAFRGFADGFDLGLLGAIGANSGELCHSAKAIDARYCLPHHSSVDPAMVKEAHDMGLGVITWTVDHEERIAELLALGVDGVITNRVSTARRVQLGR